MGKEWDDDRNSRLTDWVGWLFLIMQQAYRVLKPGGHMFVWALPRISHKTAYAIEEAGFDIRDCVYHVQGQGFPKSTDISKQIDRMAGAEREVVGENRYHSAGRKNMIWDSVERGRYDTLATTSEAKQWEGWGTALKPAVECWWLVRKPLSENTVAENVLRWGTGALNIDANRIGAEERINLRAGNNDGGNSLHMSVQGMPKDAKPTIAYGRWPSHLLLSHTSECKRVGVEHKTPRKPIRDTGSATTGEIYGQYAKRSTSVPPDSTREVWECVEGCPVAEIDRQSTGVSRYFQQLSPDPPFLYTAKASRREREMGRETLPAKGRAELTGRKEGSRGLVGDDGNNPYNGANWQTPVTNGHPTVKPLALMRWLIQLITPPQGIVLDMFAGSGSTLIAAKQLGYQYIGIELSEDYCTIARARLSAVTGGEAMKSDGEY